MLRGASFPHEPVNVKPSQPAIPNRTVRVGDRVGNEWVIADGLKQGERVIAEGVQKVRAGAQVNPKPFVAEAQGR